MEIIDWLNANDGAIIGIATIVLVSIIGYYAYLTFNTQDFIRYAPEGIIAVDPSKEIN